MGALLHLFDFNRAKKIRAHKSHDDDDDDGYGLEAPRSSLDLQSRSYCAAVDDLSSFEVEEDWEMKCYPIEASMKKLINDEVSRRSNSRNSTPSIVARLMGVDTLPLETKPNVKTKLSKRERKGRGHCTTSNTDSYPETDMDSVYRRNELDADGWNLARPREHPQEEELQKFKKEFGAWQAARLKECSKIFNIPDQENQISLHGSSPTESDEKGRVKQNTSDKDQKFDEPPMKIVILKPGSHKICDYEESWTSSSGTFEDKGSIEDFLEEVKERLRCELQGRTLKKSSTVRGSGIETPFSEKPTDLRNIARHVSIDHLARSRSYTSEEIQCTGPDSSEYISKGTRRLLTERLRNVLKSETQTGVPEAVINDHLRSSVSDGDKYYKDLRSRSFRRSDKDGRGGTVDLAPRNLKRSLSAPVSGTSFGKLLLEDRRVLTGAQVRRKHEVISHMSLDSRTRTRTREKFNIREKVSNFKHGFTLRRMLFGKKIQSMMASHGFEYGDTTNFTTVMSFNENFTEVPPSPASVCSSIEEEYWRPVDCLSPRSKFYVHTKEDNQVMNEIESDIDEIESVDQPEETDEREIPIENPVEAYVRDLLIASGLYNGSSNVSNPIKKQVDTRNGMDMDPSALFDLANEALKIVMGPQLMNCRVTGKLTSCFTLPSIRGQKLLDSMWKIISAYIHPLGDKSLESLMFRDLSSTPWYGLVDQETLALGREVASLIIGDLLDDIVKDMMVVI